MTSFKLIYCTRESFDGRWDKAFLRKGCTITFHPCSCFYFHCYCVYVHVDAPCAEFMHQDKCDFKYRYMMVLAPQMFIAHMSNCTTMRTIDIWRLCNVYLFFLSSYCCNNDIYGTMNTLKNCIAKATITSSTIHSFGSYFKDV